MSLDILFSYGSSSIKLRDDELAYIKHKARSSYDSFLEYDSYSLLRIVL